MRPTADSDWIAPEAVDVQADTERPAALTGVMRVDEWGGRGVPFPTLTDAMREGPETPEAMIYGRLGMLAESSQENAEWVLTVPGLAMVEEEATARDHDTVLAVALAEDLRGVA